MTEHEFFEQIQHEWFEEYKCAEVYKILVSARVHNEFFCI